MRKILKPILLWRDRINQKMVGKHADLWLGLTSSAVCGILAVVMLFLSPVLGVADDGTLDSVMKGAGLAYPDGYEASASYFVKDYVWNVNQGTGYHSVQTLVIQAAKFISQAVTGGRTFDIRFLAFLYLLMFLPAVMLFVNAASSRLPKFSQKLVPAAGAVIILGDVGYLTYFNSFYPEALIIICLLYMTGAALSLQKGGKWEYVWLFVFAAAASVLCFVRQYCFLAGIAGMVFCLLRISDQEDRKWKTAVVLAAVFMAVSSMGSFLFLEKDFNKADKLHAMTRGVLLQSDHPEETLEEFGIDPSYSMLADVSAYDEFPVITGENKILEEEFFSHYDTGDIVRYYAKHPQKMLSMLELSARANMDVVRENCGNYEISENKPPGARSVFWSAYSIFKNRSLPKTIGYMFVLVIISAAVTARGFSLKKKKDCKKRVYFDWVITMTLFCVAATCFVIIQSGEAALIQYNCQLGIVTDILLYLTITETLELLNIL